VDRQRFTVHRIRQKRIRITRVIDWEAALEMDGLRAPVNGTTVCSAEHHVSSAGLNAGPIQDLHERNANPLGRAHGPQVPLLTFDRRVEQRASVAGALERHDERLRRHLAQVAHAEAERPFHETATDSRKAGVERGNLEMIAHVKVGTWHHDAAD
jgi:hypothetical protein